jgi:hypothetical protein
VILIILGLAFWKVPRRLIYAVELPKYSGAKSSKKKHTSLLDCEDDDFDEELERKPKRNKLEEKFDALSEDMKALRDTVSQVTDLAKMSNIPIALTRVMKETFQCKVCLSVPIKPPVIISKCCKVLLGCETCINRWYSGPEALTKQCPACNHARGYNETQMLRGLDDFLIDTKKIIGGNDDDEQSEPELPPVNFSAIEILDL